jgi:hypothetical protein
VHQHLRGKSGSRGRTTAGSRAELSLYGAMPGRRPRASPKAVTARRTAASSICIGTNAAARVPGSAKARRQHRTRRPHLFAARARPVLGPASGFGGERQADQHFPDGRPSSSRFGAANGAYGSMTYELSSEISQGGISSCYRLTPTRRLGTTWLLHPGRSSVRGPRSAGPQTPPRIGTERSYDRAGGPSRAA